ncbi:MAG: hypothetical protein A7315_02265 [Candidatus Altiarchaeales archaeon WOR_SM1_79]|nr:MAG: hypothetical protein A7315_02265 [Candidatus Altiarchaeales archaeon WOR_SM1_79]
MEVFTLGIGECGRNMTLKLYKIMHENRFKNLLRHCEFSVTDIGEIRRIKSFMDEMGISQTEAMEDEEKIPDKIGVAGDKGKINLIRITEHASHAGGGVGGLWHTAASIAMEFVNKDVKGTKHAKEILKGSEYFDCINIFNSAGGGSGCGAGPVLMEYLIDLSEKKGLFEGRLHTATIALPFKDEVGQWRDANAASNIGRYSKHCDAIIIADNEYAENLAGFGMDSRAHAAGMVNEMLAHVWMWMPLASLKTGTEQRTKDFESTDFRRMLSRGEWAGPVVPCFARYTTQQLEDVDFRGLVETTMRDGSMVNCNPETSRKVMVIVVFPSGYASYVLPPGKPNPNLPEIPTRNELRKYLIDELFNDKKKDVSVEYLCSDAIKDEVHVIAFLTSPHIPRFLELYETFKNYLSDKEQMIEDIYIAAPSLRRMQKKKRDEVVQESIRDYENAYSLFENYLKFLKYDI